MKVTCLLGSPRVNGNSHTMAQKFCETLKEQGAEIKYFALNQLNFRGCQACDACKTTHNQCVLKDDLAAVFTVVKESDVIVLASPVYWGDVTAQLRAFIDRTYSYIISDYHEKINKERISRLKPGTKFVMILAQKCGEEKFDDIYPKYNFLFKMFLGIKEMLLIRGCNIDKKTDALNNSELMDSIALAAKNYITK